MKTAKTLGFIIISLLLLNFVAALIGKTPEKRSPKIGETAPDINLPNLEGKKLQLSQLRGKLVLVDFWASWCAPCRLENRVVARVYRDFAEQGFEVFSVSLDSDRNDWQNAILKDKLTWQSHVSDLQGWENQAARLYRIEQIPTNYLLDPNGKIIAMNLRGEEIENHVRSFMNQQKP
ncbi:MAG: TlpA family protein disulfide reductase [Microscillaceae bacterium]|jgi:peroxiredoxin|nr:TlpA family protein disulfide reductase [Microscillaceae bacterium]